MTMNTVLLKVNCNYSFRRIRGRWLLPNGEPHEQDERRFRKRPSVSWGTFRQGHCWRRQWLGQSGQVTQGGSRKLFHIPCILHSRLSSRTSWRRSRPCCSSTPSPPCCPCSSPASSPTISCSAVPRSLMSTRWSLLQEAPSLWNWWWRTPSTASSPTLIWRPWDSWMMRRIEIGNMGSVLVQG